MEGTAKCFGEGIQLRSGPNGGALFVALFPAGALGVGCQRWHWMRVRRARWSSRMARGRRAIFPLPVMRPIQTRFGVYEYATVADSAPFRMDRPCCVLRVA